MVNNAEPDETLLYAASNLGLRYLQMLPIFINALNTSPLLRTLHFRQATGGIRVKMLSMLNSF